MFFVVYSDRGLVFEGEPALKLFNILYWLVVAAASVCGCAYYLMLYNGTEYKEYLELLFWGLTSCSWDTWRTRREDMLVDNA